MVSLYDHKWTRTIFYRLGTVSKDIGKYMFIMEVYWIDVLEGKGKQKFWNSEYNPFNVVFVI